MALPQHSDRHAALASRRALLISLYALCRHLVKHHVSRRDCNCHRRVGGCGNRDDRKRSPTSRAILRSARRIQVCYRADHVGSSQDGRAADFLRNGYHHSGVCACLRTNRNGGKAVSSLGIHQDFCDGRLDAYRSHPRARPVYLPHPWQATPRGRQSPHARAPWSLQANSELGTATSPPDSRRCGSRFR